jgi:hypothetical protein
MRRPYLLSLVLVTLLGLITTIPALGGGKKKAGPPPVRQPPVISSVTANAVTVTEEKTSRTFTITQFTEITVNGQKATAAALKPGMTISVSLGTDPSSASRINATGK